MDLAMTSQPWEVLGRGTGAVPSGPPGQAEAGCLSASLSAPPLRWHPVLPLSLLQVLAPRTSVHLREDSVSAGTAQPPPPGPGSARQGLGTAPPCPAVTELAPTRTSCRNGC